MTNEKDKELSPEDKDWLNTEKIQLISALNKKLEAQIISLTQRGNNQSIQFASNPFTPAINNLQTLKKALTDLNDLIYESEEEHKKKNN